MPPETETSLTPPAGADQGADQTSVTEETISQTPADADQAGEPSLFTEEETKGLSPDLQKRVQGMVKKFTQTQQALGKDREQLAQLTAQLRELAVQQSEPARSTVPETVTDELDALIAKAAPADKELIRTLANAIEGRLRKQIAPVAESLVSTRFQTERNQAVQAHPDFEQVVTEQRARNVLSRYPGINSYDALYKLIKFEDMEREAKVSKTELQKLQARMKQSAGTEMPMGMSGEAIESTEFDALTKEQRKKLTPKQYVDLAERMLRNSR